MKQLRPLHKLMSFDEEPKLFYKLEEVKEALKVLDKIEIKTNDFLVEDRKEFEHDICIFKNKIGSIYLTITKCGENDPL